MTTALALVLVPLAVAFTRAVSKVLSLLIAARLAMFVARLTGDPADIDRVSTLVAAHAESSHWKIGRRRK